MKYGYFDDTQKEYVITTPFTPIKWINYVGTLNFGGIVDNTGGCLLCKGDPALNRITKYIAQLPASDFKGNTLYIRVKDSQNNVHVFSPFFTPTLKKLDSFQCRVGLSYSTWVTEAFGIQARITIFVPVGSNTLLQDIQITNLSDQPQTVDLIPVVEYTHFDALKQLTNADWVPQTMQSFAHREDSGHVILEQRAFPKKNVAVNYFTSSVPASSWDADRYCFLGNNEYGSWQYPLSLENTELSNSECYRGDNIGALMLHLGPLAPQETQRAVTHLGQEESLEVARPAIEKYRNHDAVDQAFQELKVFWEEYLQVLQVETPDANMNSMINIHNPRQCHTTKNWSRYLSLYQLGYGARGIGFRDSSQDLLGVVSHMPEEAREFIERLLSVQNPDGSAMHQFFPSTMEANAGDSRESEDGPYYYGDDHLWIVLTVAQYLKETGNLAFLEKEIPFYQQEEPGTVWEHVVRAIEFTWNHCGQHGVPLLGFADWNDTVNLPKGAESLMVANLFGKALLETIDICKVTRNEPYRQKLETYYQTMQQRINEVAWDGQWYVRYFNHDSAPLGSQLNEKGKIFTNGQSWPVISGFASEERAKQALNSVYEMLNTQNGIKLSTPGYDEYDPKVGGITSYPPGAKENGGIFLHSNPWVMIAETMMGNGERAFQYYQQINPASKNDKLDTFQSEPYCYPQNILGDEHPQFGLARNAWLSGTSSWTYIAGTQYLLGVRAEFDGLTIDPCVPSSWEEFKIQRKFRGALYRITVKNPDGISKGVKSMTVNGEPNAGQTIPVFSAGEHDVEVTMGKQ